MSSDSPQMPHDCPTSAAIQRELGVLSSGLENVTSRFDRFETRADQTERDAQRRHLAILDKLDAGLGEAYGVVDARIADIARAVVAQVHDPPCVDMMNAQKTLGDLRIDVTRIDTSRRSIWQTITVVAGLVSTCVLIVLAVASLMVRIAASDGTNGIADPIVKLTGP